MTIRHASLRLEVQTEEPIRLPNDLRGVVRLLQDRGFHREPQECMWVMAYDAALDVRTIVEIGRGTHRKVELHLPTAMGAVIASGAERFMLIHNHPNRSAKASPADIRLTRHVMDAANTCGLYLEDHLILSVSGAWTSMAADGILVPSDYSKDGPTAEDMRSDTDDGY